MHYYEQSDGNGDWTDFIDLLNFFNSSTSIFNNNIENRIDVKSLLKQMTVESFMLASDNLASGNNYYFYHLQDNDDNNNNNKWQLIEFDFDECFSFSNNSQSGKLTPNENPNVFTFFYKDPTDDERNPLLYKLLSISDYNSTYIKYYNKFLTVFSSDSKQQPTERYSSYFFSFQKNFT